MKNIELEKYKQFFSNVEKIIKDSTDVSDEEKLVTILLELENMIMYKRGGVSKEINNFIQNQRNRIYKNLENEWHRIDEGKYPSKECLGKSFTVAFAFNERTQEYYSFDCAEYIDKEKFRTHTNNDDKVLAWKEIVS